MKNKVKYWLSKTIQLLQKLAWKLTPKENLNRELTLGQFNFYCSNFSNRKENTNRYFKEIDRTLPITYLTIVLGEEKIIGYILK